MCTKHICKSNYCRIVAAVQNHTWAHLDSRMALRDLPLSYSMSIIYMLWESKIHAPSDLVTFNLGINHY